MQDTRSSRVRQLEGAQKAGEASGRRRTEEKITERSLLRDMVARLRAMKEKEGADPLGDLIDQVLGRALQGDKDMLAFVGKYLLGNGKVSLDELYNPPVIRKSK